MGRNRTGLTDTEIRALRPRAKAYKEADGGGLYLVITPEGGKLWRFKFRFAGREKSLSLGAYPEVSAKAARAERDAARAKLRDGIDPAAEKQERKAAGVAAETAAENTFKAVAEEWREKNRKRWSESHAETVADRLTANLYPWIGDRSLDDIDAPLLLEQLRRIEERGAVEVARRMRQVCDQVYRYAIATGRARRNPAADLRGAIAPKAQRHFAAVTEPAKVGELLRAIDGYSGTFEVRCALQLAPLVFVRPGELRTAEWAEFDTEAEEPVWRIPARKMKRRIAHIVPLARQALAIIEQLRPLTGEGRYLFPSARSAERPMSDNALNAALRRLGYTTADASAHGFRTTATTLLNEKGYSRDAVERQLAHMERDKVRAAYNRAEFLPERRRMMQGWADYLDGLRTGAKVIPLRRA